MAPKKKPLKMKRPPRDPELAEQEDEQAAEYGEGTPSGIKKDQRSESEQQADTEEELSEEMTQNFRMAFDAAREWIDEAKEDIKFKAGDQWDPEDKELLRSERRPCLTFNIIKPIVKLISGHQLQNSARIQVAPEGGEDQKFSAIADRLLNHIDEQASLDFNLGYLFAGGETTGRSYLELYMDYDDDPIFGRLKAIYHAKPGVIFPDPRGTSYDLNERQFLFKLTKKSKSELKELYPDKEKEIDEISEDSENPDLLMAGEEGDRNNYGIDPNRSKKGINRSPMDEPEKEGLMQYHVLEYWRLKLKMRYWVYFVNSGDEIDFDTDEEAQAEIAARLDAYTKSGGLPDQWAVVQRQRRKRCMYVAVRCGGQILTKPDAKSPFEPNYSGFPFFQFIADWTPEAEKDIDQIQGIVRCMKDAQREKNKARSQALHIINTTANSGWIIDSDSMEDNKKQELEAFGSTPGIIIEKLRGSTVQRIEPVPAPAAQMVREKAADDSRKEVSGLNPDLLAMNESNEPSGRAIALKIRQALTILEPDFRNFRFTKKLIGVAIMKMVPTMFDIPKIEKILGENFMANEQIDDVVLKTFFAQIEDLKYNVRIAEQGDTKTMREETFEDMMQIVQGGTAIPFEILLDFMQVPNKQELLNKMAAYQQQQMAMAQLGATAAGRPGGTQKAPPPPQQ